MTPNSPSSSEEEECASGDDSEEDAQDDGTVYNGVYVGPGNNGEMIKKYCHTSNDELLV